ncbi:hypothetical protein F4801DRAFT_581710 [Xylaria longipes]|nr:hypothetical protein F4801DRAFT_581710 [Xylaria longipes]
MASANNRTQQKSRSGEFPCPDCGKVLSRRDALVRHSRTAHGSGSQFWCQEDGCAGTRKGYKRFHDYRKHMRIVHNMTVTTDSVLSQQAVRRSRHNASEDEHREAVDQAAPHLIRQPVAQPVAQIIPPSTPAAITQAAPQAVRQVAQKALAHTFTKVPRHATPDGPQPIPTYVPDYFTNDGQPMSPKSDLEAALSALPTYVPECVWEGKQLKIRIWKREGPQPSQPTINPPPVEYKRQFPAEFEAEEQGGHRAQRVTSQHNTGYGQQERHRLTRMSDTQILMYQQMRNTFDQLEQDRLAFVSALGLVKKGGEADSNESPRN